MKLKAEKIAEIDEIFRHGQGVSWCVYHGKNIKTAKIIYDRHNAFLMSGELMPVTGRKERLDLQSVETSYDPDTDRHEVTIEALVVDPNRKEKYTK